MMKLYIGHLQAKVTTFNGLSFEAYFQIWDSDRKVGDRIVAHKAIGGLTLRQFRRIQAIQNSLIQAETGQSEFDEEDRTVIGILSGPMKYD